MKLFTFKSLEQLLTVSFTAISIAILSLWLVIGLQQQWNSINIVLTSATLIGGLWFSFTHTYNRIMVAFKRATMHIEAIHNNDYAQYAKPTFDRGSVRAFHTDLKKLSAHLQLVKVKYDQNIFLVYRLIEQLDSPIMVFNQNTQLTYANSAFNELFPQPWQIFRHASPELLGLVFIGNHWCFSDKTYDNKWQIRHSEFIDQGKTHKLMVFVNIESALRKSQLDAWQQLIRVLGHEIHNSLTPVSAIAQGLNTKVQNNREKQALTVITERCQHLQDFVSRYASITKPFKLHCQRLTATNIGKRMQYLFKDTPLKLDIKVQTIWADPALIEQVLLNIIKNAAEASQPEETIQLIFSENITSSVIEIIDNGHGFSNLDNLFVPLYSTKQHGQGIGLSFCRNIIEHHNGTIHLTNNTDTAGVRVSISLPLKSIS